MDEFINEIRTAFSKGNIIVDPDGISAIYTGKDGWIYQSMRDGAYRVFLELLSSCGKFNIAIRSGKSIRLIFFGEQKTENRVLFPALEEEMSLSDLLELRADIDPERKREFDEFFLGTDFSDGDAVLDRFSEWIDERFREKNNSVDFSSLERWKQMLGFLKIIQSAGFFTDTEIEDPGDGMSAGCITVHLDPESNLEGVFQDHIKDALYGLINASSEFSFECLVLDGFLNLDFYA